MYPCDIEQITIAIMSCSTTFILTTVIILVLVNSLPVVVLYVMHKLDFYFILSVSILRYRQLQFSNQYMPI